MSQLQIIVLSIIQGLAEFLPISSSGHLILLSKFSSFPDQGVEIDVAVHIGSVLAVLIYFYKDIWQIIKEVPASYFVPNLKNYGSRLFWLVVIGTIPAAICGLLLYHFGSDWTRSTRIIGWNIIIFGIILWLADEKCSAHRDINSLGVKDAVLIGLAQSLALIPGTSRSGITITMARILGVQRREAAKFSMLLSIPTIIGAGIISFWGIYQRDDGQVLFSALSGIGYSFIVSIMAIFFMMKWLKKYSFLPFVIYRIVLGIFLLLHSYNIMF